MLLRKLEVENFRQFHGAHSIEFATDQERNVTLVLGYNTFGKSALLNAIHFALYGMVQADLDQPGDLLNHEAAKTRQNGLSVSLEFEFQKTRYHIKRSREYIFHGGSKITPRDKADLHKIDSNSGSWLPVQYYQQLINRAIPQEMAEHFIFHGEQRVQVFANTVTHRRIGDAIRKILGCNILESTLGDLQQVVKRFEMAITKAAGNETLRMLQNSKDSWEAKLHDIEKKMQEHEDQIEIYKSKREQIGHILRDHERTKDIKLQLDKAQQALKAAEERRRSTMRDVWQWIRESCITVLSPAVVTNALKAIKLEEIRGKIPSDYQESFIKSLLDDHKCICERSLEHESAAYQAVAKLLQHGGKKDILDIVLKVKAGADRYVRLVSREKHELNVLLERLRSLDRDIASAEKQVNEYKERLQGVDVEDLAKKAKQYTGLDGFIGEFNKALGDLDRKRRMEVLPAIQDLTQRMESLLKKIPEAEKKKNLKDIADALIVFFQKQLNAYEAEAREKVLDLTNRNLQEMHRDKEAFFDDKFNIRLREKSTKIEGGKSTGETQLLVLAFTSALIKFCADRENMKDEFLSPGTVAPLVLDAPFGQLDTVFQRSAISWIPAMARQVVLFVSDSQFKTLQESADSMNRVGTCYAIQIPPGRGTPPYVINGKSIPSHNDRKDNSTTIERVW